MPSLIGSSNAPPFNLMQLVLEGPQSYFGRRGQVEDQLWLQQHQQELQGQAAQTLMGSPQLKAAIANPLDRQANWNLWAATQGGPLANQGASWLQQSLSAAYGRDATTFEDGLARSRIKLGTDEAIRLENYKVQQQKDQVQQQFTTLFGDGTKGGLFGNAGDEQRNNAMYDFIANQYKLQARPSGMSMTTDPATGGMIMVPSTGTDAFNKAVAELSPLQRIQGNIDNLSKAMDSNTLNTADAQVWTQSIRDDIRIASKVGALDKDAAAAMDNYVKEYGAVTGYGMSGAVPLAGSQQWLTQREKLRALDIQMKQRLNDWSRTYRIPLNDPRLGDPYASVPGRPPRPDQPPVVPKVESAPSDGGPSSMSKRGGGGTPANAPRAKSWWERQQEQFGQGGGASSKMGR